jgi:probable rRNA maturation factor
MLSTEPHSIRFHFADLQFSFANRRASKDMITQLIALENNTIDHINYIFCTDEYLLTLNQSYLQHDTLTDIITFHYQPQGEPILSDIYISIERVRENAQTFKTTFRHELHRVLFHGALHLCGYKDKNTKDQKKMREMEDHYLNLFHVPRGTKKQSQD